MSSIEIELLGPGDDAQLASALRSADAAYVAVLAPGDRPVHEGWRAAISSTDGSSVVVGDEWWALPDGAQRVHTAVPDRFSALSRPVVGGPVAVPTSVARSVGSIDGVPEGLWWAEIVRRSIGMAGIQRCDEVLIERDGPRPCPPAPDVVAWLGSLENGTGIGALAYDGHAHLVGRGSSSSTVSVIIPTVGSSGSAHGRRTVFVLELLEHLVADMPDEVAEVLVVVDAATPGSVRSALEDLASVSVVPVRLVDDDQRGFSFSRKVNLAAAQARGTSLLLLNDDIAVIDRGWLGRMCDLLRIDGVAAVGATLLYDDDVVQHAGVTCANGFPDHVGKGRHRTAPFPGGIWSADRSALAVTGAVLLTDSEVWDRVGGFSPELPVNYNDVDYCLKVRDAGYDVLIAGSVVMYHFESQSRDPQVDPAEVGILTSRWYDRLVEDPYHPGGFAMVVADWQEEER